jgi:polyribonucleotide nucleotidyltransferase
MKYSAPTQLPDGRYYSKVLNDDDIRIIVQLNNSTLISNFEEDEVTISLNEAGQNKINDFDSKNIDAAKQNSQAWFGKVLSDKVLETAYNKSLTNDCMIVTKLKNKNKVLTNIYTHTKQISDTELLTESTVCDVVLEFSGVWFRNKSYGSVWRIVQVRMKPPPRKPKVQEYLFQDDESVSSSDEDLF